MAPSPRRRRDRHSRGLRGPLAPPQVPLSRTRRERFDDLVLDAVDQLKQRWERELTTVEFLVEEVPASAELGAVPGNPIPLSRSQTAQIVLYRRPLEARATDSEHLGALIHDVLVEEVANLLGLSPETIDPGYDDRRQ